MLRRKIFLFLIAVLAVVAGVTFWQYQKQNFSKEILKLEILGPEKCDAGQEVEYTVKYKNNGNVRLENLSFAFEYPEKSILSADQTQRITKDLEDIYPGQEQILKFKARLFGEKGEIKTAGAFLRYQPKNLKAFYESESTFSTRIEDVPLTFSFDFPSKIIAQKEVKISLNYFSNLDLPLSGLRIKVEYPDGFEFLESSRRGIEKNEWEIPMLNTAEGGRIDILGKLSGEVGGQKIFRARLGIWLKDELVFLKEITRGVEIISPRLAISQRINGLPDYVANPGELLRYEIFFRNIGDEPLENLFLVAKLNGPFDFESINTESGRVNSSDKSLLWDFRDVSSLQFLAPTEEGSIEFWINAKEKWGAEDSTPNKSVLKNEVSVSQVKELFETKINSKLMLSQKGAFEDAAYFFSEIGEPRPDWQDVFGNSGPIPPRVGQTTTYTIIWQVQNLYNNVGNVKVRAILPQNVNLTGKIFPEQEKDKFTFDSISREIVWDIGSLSVEGESVSPQKSIAFQVAFIPSQNQRGLVATLINEAGVSGEDQFTERTIKSTVQAVDTTLPDDKTVSPGQGIVE